jgi:hypothetical protein
MTLFPASGNDAISHKIQKAPFGPSRNDAVLCPSQKAPQGPFGNGVVSPTKTNDAASSTIVPFPPHMESDTISPLNGVGPRTLEAQEKATRCHFGNPSRILSDKTHNPNQIKMEDHSPQVSSSSPSPKAQG